MVHSWFDALWLSSFCDRIPLSSETLSFQDLLFGSRFLYLSSLFALAPNYTVDSTPSSLPSSYSMQKIIIVEEDEF